MIELTTSQLRRSTAIALWWTLHALVAAVLMQYAVGDFTGKALGVGQFVPAGMAQVMRLLKVPLDPLPAFVLLFLGLWGGTYALALLKHRALKALSASEMDSLAAESLRWTLQQLVRPGWLVVALGGTALMVLVLLGLRSFMFTMILLALFIYIAPLLVLRPRHLGSNSADRSWRPSAAAVAVYVLLDLVARAADAGITALAGGLGKVISEPLSLWLVWLATSALVFVRDWQNVRSHLASRFSWRFLALCVVGTVQPVAAFVLWLMPPVLLLVHYHLFIAPTVWELRQYVPAPLATFQQMFMVLESVFPDLLTWGIAATPLLAIAFSLYMGRCLVVFDGAAGQTLARSTVFNTFP